MSIGKKIALVAFLLGTLVFTVACAQSVPSPTSSSTGQQNQQTTSQATMPLPVSEEATGVASYDKNFVLVFDDSGSMGYGRCGDKDINVEVASGKFAQNRIDVAKWATTKFIKEWVPPGTNLSLYPLNSSKHRIPLGKDNRERILGAVDLDKRGSINVSGGTPLNSALREATKILMEQRKLQLGYGEYYIVAVTDGEATDGGGGDARAGAEYALQNGIPIITIGFCLPQGHALSKHSLSYRNALNPEQLLEALKETQAELPEYDTK